MKKRIYFFPFVILIILIISGCKKDVPVQGNLSVKIIGTSSQGVKNAMVHLTPVDQTEFSDNLGNTLFQNLDVSQLYTIDISKEGYDAYTQSGIQLKGDQTFNVTINLSAKPALTLSDTIFDFDSVKVQIPLFVSNSGQGSLNWQINVGALNWLSANPATGQTTTQPNLVYLNVNRNLLQPGIYSENINITSNGGIKPLKIKVVVSYPRLFISDSIFDFDSSKVQIPLFISNKGQGVLNWQISAGSLLWISAIPNTGSTTTETDLVYVNVDKTNLPPGVYNEHIFITSNGGLRSLEIKVIVPGPPPPPSTVTDIDGNVYPTILVGTQLWMKENLRVTHSPSGDDIQSYYYSNGSEYLAIYGRLYTWQVTMNNMSQDKAQGICPDGWHVPSSDEWDSMILNLGGYNEAGGKLKATGTSYWFPPNEGATNSSGFTALPGGDRWYDGTYHYKGERAFFWTSTEYDYSQAFLSYLHNANAEIIVQEVLKVNGMSVRCIKNQ